MPVRDLWVNKRTKMPTKRYGMGNRYQAVWYVDGSERSKTFGRKVDAERHLAVTVTAQLSGEYVVSANPQLVVLADSVCCGTTAANVATRPGWSQLAAVKQHRVVAVDDSIASRWGPRLVDFVAAVARVARASG